MRNQFAGAFALLASMLIAASPSAGQTPVGDAFTYQGELQQAGEPFTGNANLTFRLYDSATGGSQIGSDVLFILHPIEDGRFTVDLDFGAVFDGDQRPAHRGRRRLLHDRPVPHVFR